MEKPASFSKRVHRLQAQFKDLWQNMQMCSSIDVKGMFIFKVLTRGFLTQMLLQRRLSSEAGLRNLGRELIRALCGALTPGFRGKCNLLSIQLQCISASLPAWPWLQTVSPFCACTALNRTQWHTTPWFCVKSGIKHVHFSTVYIKTTKHKYTFKIRC